jgi:LuxR family transcriptional regulator, maltose regulon positive regulatory protein
VVLADMWVAAGRPGRARTLFEEALRTATGHGEPYPRATADLHVGLAELDRELDDLTSADAHLETARVLGERASITENRYRWSVVMAQVCAARGEFESAMHLLDQAAALYRHGFYLDIRPIEAMRTRVLIAAGDLESAAAWADERGLTGDEEPNYLHEYEHLTVARLLLARHRSEQRSVQPETDGPLSAVRDLLARLHDAAAGRAGSLLEIQMLQALAHHASGEHGPALSALGRALADAPEPNSHVRLYLDEGAPMLDLLHAAAAGGTASDPVDGAPHDEMLRARARHLLEHAKRPVDRPAPEQSLTDPLSQRELEVLRLLATELTGPEIAGQLYVSLNTLRTHTKRIFTKLDVKTRATAVRRANERGLI